MTALVIEQEECEKEVILLRLFGDISANTFEQVEAVFRDMFVAKRYKIIVDLEQTGYISSSAAGVLMNALSEADDQHGNVVLLNPSPKAFEILDLLNLSRVFTVTQSKTEALACF